MRIGRIHSWKKVIAQVILLALPTIALAVYLLLNVNSYYVLLENRYFEQSAFFALGIITAFIFYGYQFRFITTAAILGVLFYSIYFLIDILSVGEFDAFFYLVRYLSFAVLFSLGWIAGYGFSRSRYFTIFWAIFLLALQIIVVSRITEVTSNAIILAFAPVLTYAFYIIYTAELIRNMNEDIKGFTWFIGKRLIGFTTLTAVVLLTLLLLFQKDFKAIEKDWGGSQGGKNKAGKESMTKENKDGSISNKDEMKMTSSLSKDKRLVFVAKVDNFLPDGITPNPLYFTSRYYTRFDTSTQTFETDDKVPFNDLFSPDPSTIPLYFAKADSTVLINTKATIGRKVVTADVYKVALSPHEYLAPTTAFYCQPIAVENDYKDQFKSAYRAKMWVSDLNSAYFIYNPAGNEMLEAYQQERFQELRGASSYDGVDKTFMDYYTFMPRDEAYNRITELAKSITKNASTPVDKMVAIRNYFTSKDEFGQPLYRYSDNPGIPGLPSANKLNYFLFENKKGYCAYYAGATLFLLRSLGIPSRIAAGFLTVDRSSKNPGWYWFYADQAHAWVQLYFPGYGWIDFDTTVPDQNTQQAAQPDGTPPMNTQQALLVADGEAVSIDTVAKKVRMKVKKLLYHDQNYTTSIPQDLYMDVSMASISRDTGVAKLSDIKKGTNIVAVSFAEAFKKLKPSESDSLSSIIAKAPKPAPIDEVKIMETEEQKKKRPAKKEIDSQPFNWVQAAWITLSIIVSFILLLFLLPWIIWLMLSSKAIAHTHAKDKAYHVFNATTYYLNQLGFSRKNQSPADFAVQVDKHFATGFTSFNNVYQKLKYSTLPLVANEQEVIEKFYPAVIKNINQKVPFKTRFSRFLNIYNTLHFFTKPK